MELRSFPLCLALLLSAVYFRDVATSPKIGHEETKLDQKWPNFFNPKQSILRDNQVKYDEKLERKYIREESPSITEENDRKENDEELIDYTLKGGLRGTYLILNGSKSNIENLTQEAQSLIAKILAEEILDEASKNQFLGEKTDEGLRLRTPLVSKLRTKSMGKYGAQISYFATDTPQHFIYFGNWCGKGGRSGPVDNIDACCLEQEKCYGRQIRQCPDVWQKPYSNMYGWALLEEKHPVCVRSESLCVNHVCNCDLEAALCFDHFIHNTSEIPIHMDEESKSTREERNDLELEADYFNVQDSDMQNNDDGAEVSAE